MPWRERLDKFTLSGPYGLEMPFETVPAIVVENLLFRSKNGRVGRLKVGELETAKDKVLNLIAEQAKTVQTIAGLQNWLTNGGTILVEGDLFWTKSETRIYPLTTKRQRVEEKSFSELREMSKRT